MPIYGYECRACGATFEVLQRMTDAAPACRDCGAADPTRLMSCVATTGKAEALFASARKQAATEGHFSNYSTAEKARIKTS